VVSQAHPSYFCFGNTIFFGAAGWTTARYAIALLQPCTELNISQNSLYTDTGWEIQVFQHNLW
jgi:hypothetical protein